MFRPSAFAITLDFENLPGDDAKVILQDIASGIIEMSFDGSGVIWVPENYHLPMLDFVRQGKAKVSQNLPSYFFKDKKGKWKKLSSDNITELDTVSHLEKEDKSIKHKGELSEKTY